jgi:hypothetical protein
MPMPIIHVEVNNIAREMMVPRVACGRQRHVRLFSPLLLPHDSPATFPLTSRHGAVTMRESSRLDSRGFANSDLLDGGNFVQSTGN